MFWCAGGIKHIDSISLNLKMTRSLSPFVQAKIENFYIFWGQRDHEVGKVFWGGDSDSDEQLGSQHSTYRK